MQICIRSWRFPLMPTHVRTFPSHTERRFQQQISGLVRRSRSATQHYADSGAAYAGGAPDIY